MNSLHSLKKQTRPEIVILGADQKERGVWGRECYVRGMWEATSDVYSNITKIVTMAGKEYRE